MTEGNLVEMVGGARHFYGHGSLDVGSDHSLRNYFLKSLNIDAIIEKLFDFHMQETHEIALGVIRDLDMDPETIKKRQDALRYYLNADDFPTQDAEFRLLLGNFQHLNRMKLHDDHKRKCRPFAINALYDGFVNVITQV